MAVDVGGYGSTQGLRPAKKPVPIVPVRKPAPTATYSTRRRSTPTRSTSSGGSTRRIGTPVKPKAPTKPSKPNPSVKKPPAKTPAKPSVPTIDQYLGTDAAYQQALSGSKRSLTDFLSDVGRRRGEAGTQYGQTRASMERDRQQQLDDLRNEFASRGLINSGLYGQEQGDFQSKFTEQMNALDQQQAALLADLLSQESNYRRESDLANQQAKQEALLRRTQKFNLGG